MTILKTEKKAGGLWNADLGFFVIFVVSLFHVVVYLCTVKGLLSDHFIFYSAEL